VVDVVVSKPGLDADGGMVSIKRTLYRNPVRLRRSSNPLHEAFGDPESGLETLELGLDKTFSKYAIIELKYDD
jgi:hypothetical protein